MLARWRRGPRAWITLAVALYAVVVLVTVVRVTTRGGHHLAPLPAGSAPAPASGSAPAGPGAPGQLLTSKAFDGVHLSDAKAWRIVYRTTTAAGAAVTASAVVVVPTNSSGPRPVLLWDHGTTGASVTCAPSLLAGPFGLVPPLVDVVHRGGVIVAPDYIGMGVAGPMTYLVGVAEAHAGLDAARAARQLPASERSGISIAPQTVVWGHSQGGHSALWTGIVAPTYAPDLDVVGVAAISPATDLPALADTIRWSTVGGAQLMSYVLASYADSYPDVKLDDYVARAARPTVTKIASLCGSQGGQLASAFAALHGANVFDRAPTDGVAGQRLAENTPNKAIAAPVLVAQGTSDEVIPIGITRAWVAARCAAGQPVDFRTYPGLNHTGVMVGGSPFNEQLVSWTEDRLAGKPATPTC